MIQGSNYAHDVGDKAVNAEARATLCVMKNLRIGESKIRTEREREREIGTKLNPKP